jgi:hypothetical protein
MLLLIPATAEATATNAGLVDALSKTGFGLWSLAYIFAIWRGHRDKTYGFPLVAVCLNVTWEFYFAVACRSFKPPEADLCTATGMLRWGLIFWLVLDFVILCQLLKYGWRSQPSLLQFLPEQPRRPVFYALILLLCSVAFYWQYAFVNLLTDQDGNTLAWLTNYVMSWLFVASAFFRPNARGLSFWGGFMMLLGNCAFAAWGILTDYAELTAWPHEVTAALMVGVLLVNLFYLFVLWQRRRATNVVVTQGLSVATS